VLSLSLCVSLSLFLLLFYVWMSYIHGKHDKDMTHMKVSADWMATKVIKGTGVYGKNAHSFVCGDRVLLEI